jgi:signal transduction histidine kinase
MQHMIEQLLDLIEDQLSGGIAACRDSEHDLVPIAARVVEEQRLSYPGRTVELRGVSQCVAAVDAERIAQVLTTLVGNALAHGDCTRPVRVSIALGGGRVHIEVHNHGPAIEPALLARLFEPPLEASAAGPRPEGLGLGLCIAERILRAHAGSLAVESSAGEGTRFEAVFPRSR